MRARIERDRDQRAAETLRNDFRANVGNKRERVEDEVFALVGISGQCVWVSADLRPGHSSHTRRTGSVQSRAAGPAARRQAPPACPTNLPVVEVTGTIGARGQLLEISPFRLGL